MVPFPVGADLESIQIYEEKRTKEDGYKGIITEASRVLGWSIVKEDAEGGAFFWI